MTLMERRRRLGITKKRTPIRPRPLRNNLNPRQATGRRSRSNRFYLVVAAIVAFTFVAAQRALDASTGNKVGGLTWILKNEEPRTPVQVTRQPTMQLASLPQRGMGTASVTLPGYPSPPRDDLTIPQTNPQVIIERVRKGDTLTALLKRRNIGVSTIMALARAAAPVYDLASRFQPGKIVKLSFNEKNALTALEYPITDSRSLRVFATIDNGFSARLINAPAKTVAAKKGLNTPKDPRAAKVFSEATRSVFETVRKGDYLSTLLARHGVDRNTSMALARATRPVYDLARYLKPGQRLQLAFSKDGLLSGLSYPLDSDRVLWITRNDGIRFVPHIQKKVFDTRLRTVHAEIRGEGSLFLSAKKAGLSQSMTARLASLFEWDVDFARDIRPGDRFSVVHEVKYHNGKRERDGDIMAAKFINNGRTYQVVRYTDPDGVTGYFDPKGRNVRKMFIRAPVDFTRISSRFSKKRKHPVHGFNRAHKGVDYAAPTGTPVRAAGDGRVTFRGRRGGFGKLVLIRHTAKYTTAYAHLSRYATKLKQGDRVRQGQVIGRVGATGSATGPHLHYEIRVNNKQVNPLSIQLPGTSPVARKYKRDFQIHSSRLLALLDGRETQLAALETKRPH